MKSLRLKSFVGFFICSVVLFGVTSCSNSGETPDDEVAKSPGIKTSPFKQLTGKWADTSGENEFYEVWETTDDGMKGIGVVLSEGDTVFIEHLAIFEKDSAWYYSARIGRQNRGEAILFRNTVSEDSLYIFENPDHDFPQSIAYQYRRSGALQISTRGVEDGEIRTEEFNMQRVTR